MKIFGSLRRNRERLFLLCVLFVPIDSSLEAQSTTYSFLLSDVSARSAAMAGSFVSMADDINTIFYNPAGLATVTQPQASFGYLKNLLDINSGYASYAQDISGIGMVGFGVNYVNYGTFDETDELANKIGTFGAGDLALSVGYANELEENLSYGVAGKFIYSSIADARSSAVAADLGILYLIPGANPMSLGASLLNLGTQLNPYLDTRESLPLELKIGGTIKPQHLPLLLNLDFHHLNESQENFASHFKAFSVGGEFTLSKELRFRFGYNNERRQDLQLGTSSGLAGFSFGGGLVIKNLRFDYAFVSLGKIGSFNSVAVAMNL
ncbi:MAG TPA: type IX secretion system protein PorQ [Bacteroidota bacterium]|nr:type IX secretion system protein PorQ [Bacteroidota bacterium]